MTGRDFKLRLVIYSPAISLGIPYLQQLVWYSRDDHSLRVVSLELGPHTHAMWFYRHDF